MKRLAAVAPFLIAAVVAGCGSSSSSSSTSSAAASSSTASAASSSAAAAPSGGGGGLNANESEFKITPAGPGVAPGEITITVKNVGAVTHALTVDTPSGPVSTSSIAPGKTATLKVNISKAGTTSSSARSRAIRAAGMKGGARRPLRSSYVKGLLAEGSRAAFRSAVKDAAARRRCAGPCRAIP